MLFSFVSNRKSISLGFIKKNQKKKFQQHQNRIRQTEKTKKSCIVLKYFTVAFFSRYNWNVPVFMLCYLCVISRLFGWMTKCTHNFPKCLISLLNERCRMQQKKNKQSNRLRENQFGCIFFYFSTRMSIVWFCCVFFCWCVLFFLLLFTNNFHNICNVPNCVRFNYNKIAQNHWFIFFLVLVDENFFFVNSVMGTARCVSLAQTKFFFLNNGGQPILHSLRSECAATATGVVDCVFFFFLFSLLLFHIVSYYLCLMCTHHIYSHLTLAHSPIPFDTFVNVCARIAVVVVVCCVWRCSMLLLYSHAFHVEKFGAVVRYLGNGMNVTTL